MNNIFEVNESVAEALNAHILTQLPSLWNEKMFSDIQKERMVFRRVQIYNDNIKMLEDTMPIVEFYANP